MNSNKLQDDAVKGSRLADEILRKVAGWELETTDLILHLDSPHREVLMALGHENVPESLSILEYAERFVWNEDIEMLKERSRLPTDLNEHSDASCRFELRLRSAVNEVHFFLVNGWQIRPGIIRGQGQNITDLKHYVPHENESMSSLKSVIENADDYIFIVKCDGELITFNQKFSDVLSSYFNVSIAEGANILKLIPEMLYEQWYPLLSAACAGEKQMRELDVKLDDIYHIEISVNPIFINEVVESVSFFIRDITAKWRMMRLDALESAVFEKAFESKDMNAVIDTFLEGIEAMVPGMKCFVMQKKKDALALNWLSNPGIPGSYCDYIGEIPIDSNSGSFGLSALMMEPVLISDIREHACWENYRDITLLNGFYACSAFPLISSDGLVLGTLGAYFTEVHEFTDYEMSLLLRAANVVGLLMERNNLLTEVHFHSDQLKDISASVPGVIYIVKMDPSGVRKFLFISDGVEQYLNLTREMAFESYDNIVASLRQEDREKFFSALSTSIANRTTMELEFRLSPELKPENHCFLLHALHKFNEDGTVITYGSVFDITRQKETETSILKKQVEMEALLKCMDDIVLLVNEEDVFIDIYARDDVRLFADRSDFIGKKVEDVMPENVISVYQKARKELDLRDYSADFYYDLKLKNALGFYKARLIKVTDTELILVSIKNITRERNLQFANEKLNAILAEASTYGAFGSFEFDVAGQSVIWSDQLYDIVGLSSEKSGKELFRYFLSILHPDDLAYMKHLISEAVKNNSGYDSEHRLRHVYGHYVWVRAIVKVVQDPPNNALTFRGIVIDITKSKVAESEIKRKNALLEFVSAISMKMITDSELDQSLQLLLNKIGESYDVSRIYLFKNTVLADTGDIITSQILEWTDGIVSPQIDNEELKRFNLHENGFKRWVDVLSAGEALLGNIKEFPADERKVLEEQDIKSLLVVPVFVDENWWGFLGFDSCEKERQWLTNDVQLLRSVADLIGSALEKKELHTSLSDRVRLYRTALTHHPDGLMVFDPMSKLEFCNDAAMDILSSSSALPGKTMSEIFDFQMMNENGEVVPRERNSLFLSVENHQRMNPSLMGVKLPSGHMKWLMFTTLPFHDSQEGSPVKMLMTFRDRTRDIEQLNREESTNRELMTANKLLENSLNSEIQLSAHLLNLQRQFVVEERANEVLMDSCNRVEVLSLLNGNLFTDDGNGFKTVIMAICEKYSREFAEKGIMMKYHLKGDGFNLGRAERMACALIINEIISNSCRHGFKGREQGNISVTLQMQGDYHVIEVIDDGRGLPITFNWEASNTMGFSLVKGLVSMMKGAITVNGEEGLKVIITFPRS